MLDIIYLAGLVLASPFLLYKSCRTGKYRRGWAGRFGHLEPSAIEKLKVPAGQAPPKRILLHCVSVGELLSMRRLIDELLAADASVQVIVSTTTDTGLARALEIYGQSPDTRVVPVRYPLDISLAVNRFLKTVKPRLIVLVELETWPNFIFAAHRGGIPVRIINGRLTERSFRRYRLVRPLVKAMFERVERFGVQTQAIARRFIALGAPADRVDIIPTVKYDSADFSDQIPGSQELAFALGIQGHHQVLVGGSTGPGEEIPLLDMYQVLSKNYPDLQLAIAPRKPEVVAAVHAAIEARGFKVVRRSQRPDGTSGPALAATDILLLDTMGELKKMYGLAMGIFSGRSLVKLGGSDMIEAAALARPVCFGPHTFNFTEAVDALLAAKAAVRVHDAESLVGAVRQWLQDPAQAREMGLRGRECLRQMRGSTHRYASDILAAINGEIANDQSHRHALEKR